MVRRSRGSTQLTAAEIERFLKAATELHLACCQPRLRTDAPAYRTLSDLNSATCDAIREVTGAEPPWAAIKPAWSGSGGS